MSSEPPLPPPFDDSVLGLLEWDDEEVLLGEIEYPGGANSRTGRQTVTVMVIADFDENAPAEVVARAREAFERFRRNERLYRLSSGKELNKSRWNDEEQLADEDVANLLMIATLEFDRDGGLTVFWDDGDRLFGGHNVCTRIASGGEFIDAGML
jgi:hypothetical protein